MSFNQGPMGWLIAVLVMGGLVRWLGINWQTGLIVVGGVVNLIDRIRFGRVVDYWNLFWFEFNLPDVLITMGVIGLIYKYATKSRL